MVKLILASGSTRRQEILRTLGIEYSLLKCNVDETVAVSYTHLAEIDRLSMSPLLSGEGIILEGNDTEHGGTHRKIIAYYTYYLKT